MTTTPIPVHRWTDRAVPFIIGACFVVLLLDGPSAIDGLSLESAYGSLAASMYFVLIVITSMGSTLPRKSTTRGRYLLTMAIAIFFQGVVLIMVRKFHGLPAGGIYIAFSLLAADRAGFLVKTPTP